MKFKNRLQSPSLFCLLFAAFSMFSVSAHAQKQMKKTTGSTYKVNNVESFLNALGSDRTIIMAAGDYRLYEFDKMGSEIYSFEEVYDGRELVVRGVKNLTIKSSEKAHLITKPAYGNVIKFTDSENIRLEGLKAGHGVFEAHCVGGVFNFFRSLNIHIENCDLYGSGVYGIETDDVIGLKCKNTVIRDCSYGLLYLNKSMNMEFENCTFRDSQEFDMVGLTACTNVVFTSCEFTGNEVSSDFSVFFSLRESYNIILDACTVKGNVAPYFTNSAEQLKLVNGTKTKDNSWTKGFSK